jgi:hypothetical protein
VILHDTEAYRDPEKFIPEQFLTEPTFPDPKSALTLDSGEEKIKSGMF